MPCSAGLRPVHSVVNADAVVEGTTEVRGASRPSATSGWSARPGPSSQFVKRAKDSASRRQTTIWPRVRGHQIERLERQRRVRAGRQAEPAVDARGKVEDRQAGIVRVERIRAQVEIGQALGPQDGQDGRGQVGHGGDYTPLGSACPADVHAVHDRGRMPGPCRGRRLPKRVCHRPALPCVSAAGTPIDVGAPVPGTKRAPGV